MVKTSVQTRRLQRRRAALKQELVWLALLTLGAISAVALGADAVLGIRRRTVCLCDLAPDSGGAPVELSDGGA